MDWVSTKPSAARAEKMVILGGSHMTISTPANAEEGVKAEGSVPAARAAVENVI